MELLLSYSLLFFSLLLISVIFLKHKATQRPALKLPPGPWPLPFLGNVHNLIGYPPHRTMRDLSRRYGSLMFLLLGETPTIIVSSSDAAREIMKTRDTSFASRPLSTTTRFLFSDGKGIIFSPYGEYWRQMRKICILELLSMKRVRSFRSIREEEVGSLMEHISWCSSQGQLVNLSKRMTLMINDIAARATIGSKCKNQSMFLRELDTTVKLLQGFNLVDLFPSSWLARFISGAVREATRSRRALDCLLDDVINQHREKETIKGGEEQDDLVEVLLKIHDEGTLHSSIDMDTVKQLIFDLFAAGSETSATVLEWVMSELIRNPLVMKKAQLEVREVLKVGCANVSESDIVKLSYLHQVIKETLRLHPPVPLLVPRKCRETCRISCYDIPEGTTVLVNVWAIGRDPRYWKDPEEFIPERFNKNNVDFKGLDFEFLPFGSGRRMCPGMSFGLASVELALASLLYHFDWKLPHEAKLEELDMSESLGITTHRKVPLELLATSYKSCVA